MEYKLHNGSGSLCCKGCSRQDKKLNTYDWLADIPGNSSYAILALSSKRAAFVLLIFILLFLFSKPTLILQY